MLRYDGNIEKERNRNGKQNQLGKSGHKFDLNEKKREYKRTGNERHLKERFEEYGTLHAKRYPVKVKCKYTQF